MAGVPFRDPRRFGEGAYEERRRAAHPDRNITMLIPELVESHWYHYLLHNNRPEAIRALLLFNGNQRITVVSIPYHLRS